MKIAILGAGISGLLAGWALEKAGIPSFEFYESQSISTLRLPKYGAMYLHDACGLPYDFIRSQRCLTNIIRSNISSPESASHLYHKKIWGNSVSYIKNSVERLELSNGPIESVIYSMDDAINYLLNRYENRIHDKSVLIQQDVFDLAAKSNYVISTIPFYILDPNTKCEYEKLYIAHSNVEMKKPDYINQYAFVTYNCDPNISWYRISQMFGKMSIEYMNNKNTFQPLFENKKIKTCQTTQNFMQQHQNILLEGRWGRWNRTVLSHQVYYNILNKFGK